MFCHSSNFFSLPFVVIVVGFICYLCFHSLFCFFSPVCTQSLFLPLSFVVISFQSVYAKAIYDNIAESPDELAFKRGDLLTVIEQDEPSLGWWLCEFRGRQVNPHIMYINIMPNQPNRTEPYLNETKRNSVMDRIMSCRVDSVRLESVQVKLHSKPANF